MNRLTCILLIALLATFTCSISAKEQAFTSSTLTQLSQKHTGKKWLMVLWSMDCPPCFKELEMIGKLAQKNADLPVVVINADGDDSITEESKAIIKQFNLETVDRFYFVDGQTEASRFQIDPSWHGELPRSYFVNQQGQFRGKSGLLSEIVISQWLSMK